MLLRAAAGALLLLLIYPLSAPAARPLPVSSYDPLNRRSIHVFSDQLHGGLSEQEARFAATHYVGVQKMTLPDIRRIRAYNENFLHLHYKLAITVDSIADYAMIIDGQWLGNSSGESNWRQVRTHPGWFLLDSAGKWTVHGGRRMIMDIANPEFREWWVTSCIREMSGNECDGVFADTYTVEATSFQTTNTALFNSVSALTSSWIPKLNDYGRYVYTKLDSAGFYFFPNIDNLQTGWVESAGAHYYAGDNMHAAMMEGWGGWPDPQDAQTAITRAVRIQQKGVFLHGEGYFGEPGFPNPDLSPAGQRMWLAGTYLLANQGRMYLSMYGPGELGMSDKVLWFPEYKLDLGPWKSTWSDLSQVLYNNGVFRREYEKGWVLCNMNGASRTVALPDTMYLAEDAGATALYWVDSSTGREETGLAYRAVTSLEMPRMSAAVLFFEVPSAGCEMPLPGDFDGDGAVNLRDAVYLMRAIAGGSQDPCLDYNGDGRRSVIDILKFILFIAGSP